MLPQEELGGKTKEFEQGKQQSQGASEALECPFCLLPPVLRELPPPSSPSPALIPKSCVFPAFFSLLEAWPGMRVCVWGVLTTLFLCFR